MRLFNPLLLAFLVAAAACSNPPVESSRMPAPAPGIEVQDSLLLVNRTDSAFVYLAFHPLMARPVPTQVEVDLAREEPSELVRPDGSAALWPCDSLARYEGYTLHLYSVAPPPEDAARTTGYLSQSLTLTPARLQAAREEECRLIVF